MGWALQEDIDQIQRNTPKVRLPAALVQRKYDSAIKILLKKDWQWSRS